MEIIARLTPEAAANCSSVQPRPLRFDFSRSARFQLMSESRYENISLIREVKHQQRFCDKPEVSASFSSCPNISARLNRRPGLERSR
ncbi:MAG: hypothetical protein ACRCUE_01200, partial [Bosea sp. (in: a-proteobacteria)]